MEFPATPWLVISFQEEKTPKLGTSLHLSPLARANNPTFLINISTESQVGEPDQTLHCKCVTAASGGATARQNYSYHYAAVLMTSTSLGCQTQ